jgi:outer membrane receptor for ferrienterochelin and colicin
LEPTTVTAEAPVPSLVANGFYDRQRGGTGLFLDRQAIERRSGARELGDLLRAIPGVTVDFNGLIRLRGIRTGAASACGAPLVFLDGIAVNRREAASGVPDPSQWQRSIDPDDIEAIELYRSPAEVPARYNSGGTAACGVILIWGRRGR